MTKPCTKSSKKTPFVTVVSQSRQSGPPKSTPASESRPFAKILDRQEPGPRTLKKRVSSNPAPSYIESRLLRSSLKLMKRL